MYSEFKPIENTFFLFPFLSTSGIHPLAQSNPISPTCSLPPVYPRVLQFRTSFHLVSRAPVAILSTIFLYQDIPRVI